MSLFETQAIFPGAELHLIKKFMQEENLKPSQWLLGTGLSDEVFKSPQTLVSLQQFDIIYRNVFRLVRSPDKGLRLGKALNLSRWGMLSLALLCSKSLGAALATANHYRTLVRSRFDLAAEIHGEQCFVRVSPRGAMAFPVSREFGFEILLASLRSQICHLLGEPFAFAKVQLPYSPPAYFRAYHAYCGGEVLFDCAEAGYWIPKELLERKLPLANPIAEKQTIAICETELGRVNQVQAGDIRWMVKNELTGSNQGLPGLEDVARRLTMTPRTLRRKLQQADTSFRELYQQCQMQRALQQLSQDTIPLAAIALHCGFRDLASFREAFKRWSQLTPREYRAQFRHNEARVTP